MKKQNVWSFGCSFTEGFWNSLTDINFLSLHNSHFSRLTVNKDEIPYHKKFDDFFQWNVITRLLNKENTDLTYFSKPRGKGGSGMRHILFSILNELSNIKSGDIVFLGTTQGTRDLLLTKSKKILHPTSIAPIVFNSTDVEELLTYLALSEKEKKDKRNSLVKPNLRNYSDEYLETCVDYYLSVGREEQLDLEKDYINYHFRKLGSLLEEKEVEVYYWDTKLWWSNLSGEKAKPDYSNTFFETSYTWSNGQVEDLHWSPNGSQKAGYFFKWCIDNKIKEITPKYLHSFNSHLKYLNLPYLPFSEIKLKPKDKAKIDVKKVKYSLI